MSNPDLIKAREWVERIKDNPRIAPDTEVAVRVIQSLPDHIIDAEKVRRILHKNTFCGAVMNHCTTRVVEQLQSLITPSLPTLAELIEQGGDPATYRGMQADVEGNNEPFVIIGCSNLWVTMANESRFLMSVTAHRVTPLPGLPRMVWPGSSLSVSGESEPLSVESEESEGPRGATQEVEYRIVPTDHNGGKYQTRKWTRMVTEWQPDE